MAPQATDFNPTACRGHRNLSLEAFSEARNCGKVDVCDEPGTHLRRDTVLPKWFPASQAAAPRDGYAVHCWVTAVICQLSRLKRIPRRAQTASRALTRYALFPFAHVLRPDCIAFLLRFWPSRVRKSTLYMISAHFPIVQSAVVHILARTTCRFSADCRPRVALLCRKNRPSLG
jgi:hypothetical protein